MWALCGLYVAASLPAPWGVTTLPSELLQSIVNRLALKDAVMLGQMCREMRSVVDSDQLWEVIYRRDFAHLSDGAAAAAVRFPSPLNC